MINTPFDKYVFLNIDSKDSFWSAVGITLIFVSIIFFKDSLNQFTTLFLLSVGIIIVPRFVRRGANLIRFWQKNVANFVRVPKSNISELFDREFLTFCSLKISLPMGIICSLIAFSVFSQIFPPFKLTSLYHQIIASFIIFISSFICGVGLLSLFDLAKLFYKIGKFPVRIDQHAYGILGAGKKLLQCYFLGCLIWFMYSASAVGWINYTLLPFYVLSIPSLFFIISSFILALIPLHKRMVDDKVSRLSVLEELMEREENSINTDLSSDKIEFIENLSNRINRINSLPEWPFNSKTIIHLIGSSFLAILPNIIAILINVI